jgi:HEAT repeat protein
MELAYAFFDPASAPKGFKKHVDHVTRLLEAADSNNQSTRRNALKTLATVDDPRITDFLVKQTLPGVGKLKKKEAIFYMRVRGNAKVLPRLHQLLKAKDNLTRIFTAVALEGIGMEESMKHLLIAYKREQKDRVRSHLLRALAGCCTDPKRLEKIVIKGIKARPMVDRVTALHIASSLDQTKKLTKALLKALNERNSQVRSAAYIAVGTMPVMEAKKPIVRKIRGERGTALASARWALEQMGGAPFDGDEDPAETVRELLPDYFLYDGSLEDPNPGRRRGGGGGGGGAGGGGRR